MSKIKQIIDSIEELIKQKKAHIVVAQTEDEKLTLMTELQGILETQIWILEQDVKEALFAERIKSEIQI